MFVEDAFFEKEELGYIAKILRGAYTIKTANGDEDELLGDFLQALDDERRICCKDC